MKTSIHLGPIVLPSELLILLAAVTLGMFVAQRLNRRLGRDVGPVLWRIFLGALLIARLAFVVEYRAGYLESPLDILNIADGGWNLQAGILGAWICALFTIKRIPGRRKPLLAALSLATVILAAGSTSLAFGSRDGAPELPAVSVPTPGGQTAALSDFLGKPSIVNLWATWCPPCQHELPVFQQAQAEHPEVNFVFLNQGEPAEKVQGFLAARHLALHNVLLDLTGEASAEFGTGALPTTLLFDAQGHLIGTHLGEMSHGTLAESLAQLNAGSTPGK